MIKIDGSHSNLFCSSSQIRERDDLIQIWNTNAARHGEARVIEKIKSLLPSRIKLNAIFYKRKYFHSSWVLPIVLSPTSPSWYKLSIFAKSRQRTHHHLPTAITILRRSRLSNSDIAPLSGY